MFYVYILQSNNNDEFYVGFTKDLRRRYREHLAGKNWTSSRMGEFELIFYESFKNKEDAKRRESYFKTSKGRSTLRMMLREYLSD